MILLLIRKCKTEMTELPAGPTQALGQEVLDELGVISNVQHAVDAGVHQVLLLVPQILADIFGDKHDVSLHVDHEKEAVQGLSGTGRRQKVKRGCRSQGTGERGKGSWMGIKVHFNFHIKAH